MDPGFVSLRQLNAAREQLIQCGECLIIFELRNMMYRFVSQSVVLQFFFLVCLLTFGCMHKLMNTGMNIFVLMCARAHL